ncbi:MAG: hypothetical protein ACP5RD_05220, partial [bacterium]
LDYPTYILFDIFEIDFYKDNKKYILTNKNSSLEIIDTESKLVLKPIIFGFNNNEIFFLSEENFEKINDLSFIDFENFITNNDYYVLNRKNIIDFKVEENLILICYYNHLNSYLYFFDFEFNLKDFMEFKNEFIIFDVLYIDNNEFILSVYLDKKIIFYKLLSKDNKIIVLNQKEFKLKLDDIIHIKLSNSFVILSSFNRIYLYKLVPESRQLINIFEGTNLFIYNISGYEASFEKKIVDGEWRQTIWGNIKDINIYEDIVFVADNQYSDIRYLDVNTGKSHHIKLKGIDNYENIKGKILSISILKNAYENSNTLFFIDSLFKKIRFIYNNYVYSLFYDEEIYNYSKIRAYNYKPNNIIFYSTSSIIKRIRIPTLELLVNKDINLGDIIQKEEIKI